MDYQVFPVRATGGTLGNRFNKAAVLRVTETSILILSTLPSHYDAAPVEFSFEKIKEVIPSLKDERALALSVFTNSSKTETLLLFCDSRSELLTTILNKLDDLNAIGTDYNVKKHCHERGALVENVLRVRHASIVKMVHERRKVNPAKKINFNDIVRIQSLADDDQVVLLYLSSRMLKLSFMDAASFLTQVCRNMKDYLNRDMQVERISTSTMVENVTNDLKRVKGTPILFHFDVLKKMEAKLEERWRTVLITREHLIEKSGDEILAMHSLNDIIGLIVNDKNQEEVVIEYESWRPTKFYIRDRDGFMASIANVTTNSSRFDIRMVPHFRYIMPEAHRAVFQFDKEMHYISRLMLESRRQRDIGVLHTTLKEYASNIHLGKSQCYDQGVVQTISELLHEWSTQLDFARSVTCCSVLNRLFSSRQCFDSLKTMPNVIRTLIQCMRSENAVLVYAASVVLRSAIRFQGERNKQEIGNKLTVLSAENMQQLTTSLHIQYVEKNFLKVYGTLQLLILGIDNVHDTEQGRSWLRAFEASSMAIGHVFCALSRSGTAIIHESASFLLESFLTKTSLVVSNRFQSLCLEHCLVLVHLQNALFSDSDSSALRSKRLTFFMLEGHDGSSSLLQSILPKGVFVLYNASTLSFGKDKMLGPMTGWMKTLDVLRYDTIETPLLIWNDMKRLELQEFLRQEIQQFENASKSNCVVSYNFLDATFTFSSASEGQGTIIGNVHLELLVDHLPDRKYPFLWELHDPASTFNSVFQSLVFGFTSLFGSYNPPEVDLRLAVQAITRIYERYPDDLVGSFDTLSIVEAAVGMLREAAESAREAAESAHPGAHQVLVFKLLVFLLTIVESRNQGRTHVLRFVRAGGARVLVTLIILSLAECCNDKFAFEYDGCKSESNGFPETVKVIGVNGETRLARVPSGKIADALVLDGSIDAKEAVKWQDEVVPSKIQLGTSLDLLEALLRTCGSESNAETFPPPAICSSLCKDELLCHLVQSLLRAKTPVFGRIMNILSYLMKVETVAMSRIYRLGLFEILLWKLIAGDIVEQDKRLIVKFLRVSHLIQLWCDEESRLGLEGSPWRTSILCLYLPAGLITKLICEDPDQFLAHVNGDEDNPEVVWNWEMKTKLATNLSNELGIYVKYRATDPMALYIYEQKSPLLYPELSDAVYSAPFYLHNFLDAERYPNYPIKEPAKFLDNLMQDLRNLVSAFNESISNANSSSFWRKESSKLRLLISSLSYLLERVPGIPLPRDTESLIVHLATPALRSFVTQREDYLLIISDILLQSTNILRRLCALSTSENQVPHSSVTFTLGILSLATRFDATDSRWEAVIDAKLSSPVVASFQLLELVCSSRAGREFLWTDMRWKKGLWWALTLATDVVSVRALHCLKHFVIEEEFLVQVIKQALHLPFLLSSVHAESTFRRSAAAATLKSLLCNGSNREDLIARLIPRPLLACLSENLETYLAMVTSDMIQPVAIWYEKVRDEFCSRLDERIQQRGFSFIDSSRNVVHEDELQWLQGFKYGCLGHELVIGGCYVRGLMNCNLDGTTFSLEVSLIKQLLNYLEEHYRVTVVQDYDGSDVGLEDYLSVLAALRECILYSVKLNKELVSGIQLERIAALVLRGQMVYAAQVEVASVIAALSRPQAMVEVVLRSRLVEVLAVQIWESASQGSGDDVLRSTLEVLYSISERMPATVSATNAFASTLLPLLAIFCGVELQVLRGRSGGPSEKISKESRLQSAKVLGQVLLAGNGVNRRSQLLRDIKGQKPGLSREDSIGQATDMYELLSILERSAVGNVDEEPKVIRSFMLLLPLEILSALARDASKACRLFDSDEIQTPRLVWNEFTRQQVQETLRNEISKVGEAVANNKTFGLPEWCLHCRHPVFLRWTLVAIPDKPGHTRPTFRRDDAARDYALELYLGGFYIDQLFRKVEYEFGIILTERLLNELRKALVTGRSTDGLYAEAFGFDQRRRLLLALLLLFKVHPHLLTGRSNIDILLPLYELINSDRGPQQRALVQPAVLLLYCTTTHPDIADCMSSEELVYTLSSFLTLKVPRMYAGEVATDPRLCSLMLLLRLMRLSSNTVEIVLKLGVMSKLEDLLLDIDGSSTVKRRAAECLAVMCGDRRRGATVQARLEKLVPAGVEGCGSWRIPLTGIKEELIEMKSLRHFLEFPCPSPWWTSDTPEGIDSDDEEDVEPFTVVEATLTFPKAKMSDFNSDAETVFRRRVASMARVDLKNVRLLRKRIGSVIIDFEVSFETKPEQTNNGPEAGATAFKDKLETEGSTIFSKTFFEPIGGARLSSVSVKQVDPSRRNGWKSRSFPASGDKTVIYVDPAGPLHRSRSSEPSSRVPEVSTGFATTRPSDLNHHEAFLALSSPSVSPSSPSVSPPQTPPSPLPLPLTILPSLPSKLPSPPPTLRGFVPPAPPPPPLLPRSSSIAKVTPPPLPPPPPPKVPSVTTTMTMRPSMVIPTVGSDRTGTSLPSNGKASVTVSTLETNGTTASDEMTTDGSTTQESEGGILVRLEDGRMVPLEKGLEGVLEGADITLVNLELTKLNFLDSFEDATTDLCRMVERYPKLIQKYPLQPQLCYDLMTTWEENCIDRLLSDELRKYGRSIASFDICRQEDPGTAVVEAKRKFQGILKIRKDLEWKEKSKQLKGDMSAELAKAVGGRMEKLTSLESGREEVVILSKGKIKPKKKNVSE